MNFKSLLIAMGVMATAGTISASAQTYVYEVDQEVTYNHKIYKVTGENIVANSTFADGTYAGWVSTDAGNAVDASAWEILNDGPNGVNYLHNTGAVGGGSGTANNIRCTWDLEAGKTYLASYYTKGSNANVRFWNSALEGVKTPDNPLALLEGTNSADWMQNMVVFEATEEAHKALLNCAWCGNGFGLTYINIVPVEQTGEEEVELTTIEPDTYYYLQIDTFDLYLSAGWQDDARQVNTLELGQSGYEQVFKFVPVADKEGVYNLIGLDGRAIWASGGWDCFWNSEPTEANLASAEYQFTVESEVGYILIKTKNQYLGSDGIWGWSKLWTNKTGEKVVKFVPEKYIPYVTIEPDVYYNLQIQDTTNPELYFSAGWQEQKQQVNTLALGEAGYEQAFKFVAVPDTVGVYNIIGLDGKAIYASGGWDCFWTDAPTEENLASAEYQFTVESQRGYINIMSKNGYIGSDGMWNWSKLYTDKGIDKAVNFVPVLAEPVTEGLTVYFDNSASQWETVYAYVWNDDANLAAWPGEEMTKGEA
ncbi:MAG: starch-binding protein, partial [Muribaculaceae bacterium]|nr:starch-binding protein [Muribaculaceae bacterium]